MKISSRDSQISLLSSSQAVSNYVKAFYRICAMLQIWSTNIYENKNLNVHVILQVWISFWIYSIERKALQLGAVNLAIVTMPSIPSLCLHWFFVVLHSVANKHQPFCCVAVRNCLVTVKYLNLIQYGLHFISTWQCVSISRILLTVTNYKERRKKKTNCHCLWCTFLYNITGVYLIPTREFL